MQTVLIVIHLMIVLALVVVVLLQKSEGGALGIGGGGGFMAGRGQSNPLSRLTAYLAAGFFATSIALTIIAGYGGGSAFDRLRPNQAQPQQPAGAPSGPQAPLGTGQGGILPALKPAGAPAQPTPPIGGANSQPAQQPAADSQPSTAPAEPARGDVNTPPQDADRQTPGGAQTAPMPEDAKPVAPQVSDPGAAGTRAGEEVKQAPAQPTSPQGADTPAAPDKAGPPPTAGPAAPSGGQ